MQILGDYTIDIVTKRVRLAEQLMPLFCRQDMKTPGLGAYFLNTINYERATVEKQFFTALTNLSNFKIEHLIKLKDNMIKIKNTGKVFLDKNSKTKKLMGTIVSIDHSNANVINWNLRTNPETNDKVEQQVFNVEDLLNRFVKKQRVFCTKDTFQVYVKTDIRLPKLLVGDSYTINGLLQQLYYEVIEQHSTGEVTLMAKLANQASENVTVNLSIVLKNNLTVTSKSINFSAAIAEEKIKNEETSIPNLQKPLHILLVEDHEINQLIATNLLKREFNNVCIDLAENGLTAFEKVQKNQYDLILMDINMPVLNGIEATKKIRAELNSVIPILALSAHVFPQEIQNCFNAGMNDFIGKPININSLKQKIRKALISSKGEDSCTYRYLNNSDDCDKKIAI